MENLRKSLGGLKPWQTALLIALGILAVLVWIFNGPEAVATLLSWVATAVGGILVLYSGFSLFKGRDTKRWSKETDFQNWVTSMLLFGAFFLVGGLLLIIWIIPTYM